LIFKCNQYKKIKFCKKKITVPRRCIKYRHFKKCCKRSKGRRIYKKHKWVGGRKICKKYAKKRVCHKKKRFCYKKRRVDVYKRKPDVYKKRRVDIYKKAL